MAPTIHPARPRQLDDDEAVIPARRRRAPAGRRRPADERASWLHRQERAEIRAALAAAGLP